MLSPARASARLTASPNPDEAPSVSAQPFNSLIASPDSDSEARLDRRGPSPATVCSAHDSPVGLEHSSIVESLGAHAEDRRHHPRRQRDPLREDRRRQRRGPLPRAPPAGGRRPSPLGPPPRRPAARP